MLQDSNGRTITSLRVSVTDRCNLRCRYCMPEEGVDFVAHEQILRYEEIERIIGVALGRGITKIRLTGGEPLVRKGFVDFASRLSRFKDLQKLSLTTNGTLLTKYAKRLKQAGIEYLNISLDTLNREKFHKITRFDQLNNVLDGIRAAKETGFRLIKINVVAKRGFNDDELFDFVKFADEYGIVLRFIEYMPFFGNQWEQRDFLSSRELRERLEQHYVLVPLNGDPSAPARMYNISGHNVNIGFISSISEKFCMTCNRLRLTADGYLRPCLHGDIEIDVKGPIRRGASNTDIVALLQEAADRKPASSQYFLNPGSCHFSGERAMVRIGG